MKNPSRRMITRVKQFIPNGTQLKNTLLNTGSPRQIAWGSVIGVLVALTPTMGIQMYMVTAIWLLIQPLRCGNFSLPVAIAWVWISNPLTVPFLYAAYYFVGYYALNPQRSIALDPEPLLAPAPPLPRVDAELPQHWFTEIIDTVLSTGWTTLIGSLIVAIPLAVLSYPATLYFLRMIHYRASQS